MVVTDKGEMAILASDGIPGSTRRLLTKLALIVRSAGIAIALTLEVKPSVILALFHRDRFLLHTIAQFAEYAENPQKL